MSRILLFIEHKENRRLLAEWLAQRHEIVLAETVDDLNVDFDCGIFDGVALSQAAKIVRARRKASEPRFLPCLLITSRQDLRLANQSLWQTVDELIFTPIEKLEMMARVDVLLHARELSLLLDESRRQEALARERAEQANHAKMEFLAMISHELRTPLASIKGFSSSLLADDISFAPEAQREFIEVIDAEADKLNDLVGQLLDLSRLQAGGLRISPHPQQFASILAQAGAQLDVLTQAHELQVNIPDGLPNVMADSLRIAQVLTNLVGNATKYSPPNTRITINVAALTDQVRVEVSDEGSGIPADARETVFEAFQQLERKDARLSTGAGLGLAICRGLVEAHSGRIWIADHDGPGTTVAFTLPIAPAG